MMKYRNNDARIKIFSIIGVLFIIIPFLTDIFYYEQSVFMERRPLFDVSENLKTVCSLFSVSFFLLASLDSFKTYNHKLSENLNRLDLFSFVLLAICSTYFLFLFFFDSELFSRLTLEDGITEDASAVFSLISGIIMLYLFISIKGQFKTSLYSRGLMLVLGVGLIFVGLEEVSYFQRVVDIETPQLFQEHSQYEINIHNFATNYFENLYYFGVFVFFSVIPFLYYVFPENRVFAIFDELIPSRIFIFLGLLSAAYNYDMWSVFPMQFAFFGSVAIVIISFFLFKGRINRILSFISISIAGASQYFFLTGHSVYERIWEITEYREFLISLTFLLYAVGILYKLRLKTFSST